MNSAKFWVMFVASTIIVNWPGVVRAADYPTKPIKFVCWATAGSPLDVMMRQLAKQMTQVLGQSVPVENRPGGSGAVAMSYVMSQPADGYTILSTTMTMTFTMATGRVPFTPDDFIVLPALQAEPSSVAVLPDSRFKSLKQFVNYLHEHPNGLKVGGANTFGFHHLMLYRLEHAGNFKVAWVPFNGGSKAAVALLGGDLDATVMTPSSAWVQVQDGKIRLLGVSSAERSKYFPTVPTFKESGYDVVGLLWRGIMVKKGTPKVALDTLLAAIKKIEGTNEWKKFMEANGQLSYPATTLLEMQNEVREEVNSSRSFLKKAGYIK